MKDPYFFGYGSLVNTKSHSYTDPQPATLKGWRRAWVATARYPVVLLSGVRAAGHSIKGLIAAVPDANWAALDTREAGYARLPASEHVEHRLPETTQISVYAVDPGHIHDSTEHMILLSYLDVVVQGFHEVYGEEGVEHFFDTTDNWHTPIVDDRADPFYPRHQKLTRLQKSLVDDNLERLSAQIKQRHEASLPAKF